MTTKQYLAILKKLGLTPASQATSDALGLSVRHCQRLAAGAPIPGPVAALLRLMVATCGSRGRPDLVEAMLRLLATTR